MRCTQATLEALGIYGKCPKDGCGVVQSIQEAGFKWTLLQGKWTVKKFVEAHPKGKFYLSTTGHAMALVNGILTDTSERGKDRRRIFAVVEIK